jgi:hypothetical protein
MQWRAICEEGRFKAVNEVEARVRLPQFSGCNMYSPAHMTCIVHVSFSSYDLPQGSECLEGAPLEGNAGGAEAGDQPYGC